MSIQKIQLENMTLGEIATKIPDGACNSWRALYQGLAELEDDLIQHIHTENNILFAR